jgi:5'-nucleotidase / UDP-sugar diphosphatase
MNARKFTILHSNDMHGDFLSEAKKGSGKLIGGLPLLSGYVNKVRSEEENVLYVISGDMLQGSLIDSEYKGISTIEIMNFLAPDVVCVGNHEVDYGLPHLLFLERVANFPIVNANLYIKKYGKRIMQPYVIIKMAGFEILFTGILTEKVMDSIKTDELIGTFVDIQEASAEVGKICNAYKNDDIDLTILLSHIGFDSDVALAKMLKPEWGVDMIIGGHSHTILEQPEDINGILIAQAGVGTDQIGRFDIVVDDDTNRIIEHSWKLIPIVEGIAEPDSQMVEFIASYKKKVDKKYNTLLCKLGREHTHPKREIETTLGNLVADAFAENAQCDVMLVGSGSIRVKSLGPVVTLQNFQECFPYDDSLSRFTVTGEQLMSIFNHIMRLENRDGEGECYQVNVGVSAVYDDRKNKLVSLSVKGQHVDPKESYTLCMQGYHLNNAEAYLGVNEKDLFHGGPSKVVTTSARDVLEEYLRNNQNVSKSIEGRLIFQ